MKFGFSSPLAPAPLLLLTTALLLSPRTGYAPPDFKLPSVPVPQIQLFKRSGDLLKETGQAPAGPGGMCILPTGETVISCHQFFDSPYRVMKRNKNGEWEPFPDLESNTRGSGAPVVLDSVLGIACDSRGIVWMLDNGRSSEMPPKLVAWDTRKNAWHRHLILSAVTPTSFLKNLALDPSAPYVYISDPADGIRSALVVVDLSTGLQRRVLQGHYSVKRDPAVDLELDGRKVEVHRPDGQTATPLTGVSPIAVDRKGEWLYYGPRNGTALFKIRTALLQQNDLAATSLQAQVTGVSPKPVCESMAIDAKGRIYFGDIPRGAIDYVTPDDDYLNLYELVNEPHIVWPGGLGIGPGGKIHFFSSQLHRTPFFNGGKDVTTPPFYLFEARPLPSSRFGF